MMILSSLGVFAEEQLTLDDAISKCSFDMNQKLPSGQKVIIIEIKSDNLELSEYLNEELTFCLVNNTNLEILDRQNIDAIKKETSFQFSGEVSDESAQAIGKKLGAQSIIVGSLETVGYKLRIKSINVETAKIEVLCSYSINPLTLPGKNNNVNIKKSMEKSVNNNFSIPQRIGASVANVALGGIGSWVMGDYKGGMIITGTEFLGFGLMVWGSSLPQNVENGEAKLSDAATALMFTGLSSWCFGVIFSAIRPYYYNKTGLTNSTVAISPYLSDNGNIQTRLTIMTKLK